MSLFGISSVINQLACLGIGGYTLTLTHQEGENK